MTIIVEDGSIVANANSYIDTTDFAAYATAREYTVVGTAETLLIEAMDYLESQVFIGIKHTSTQSLQWPRDYAYIDGYLLTNSTIPQLLIDVQCEIAMAIDAGNGPLDDIARTPIRTKVDVIEVEYEAGTAPFVVNRKIQNKLWKLLSGGGSRGNMLNVDRA